MGLYDQTILFTLQAKDIATADIEKLKRTLESVGIAAKEGADTASAAIDKMERAQKSATRAAEELALAERHVAEADARAAAAAAVLAREQENVAKKSAETAVAQELLTEATKKGGDERRQAAGLVKKAMEDEEAATKRLDIAQRSLANAWRDQTQASKEIESAKDHLDEAKKKVDELTKAQKEAEKATKDTGTSAKNAAGGFATMGAVGLAALIPLKLQLQGLRFELIGAFGEVAILGVAAAAGAVLTGAALATIPLAVGAIGIMSIKANKQVADSFKQVGETAKTMLQQDVAPMVPFMVGIAHQATDTLKSMAPELKSMFAEVGPELNVVAGGLFDFVHQLVDGMAIVVKDGMPVMVALAESLNMLGQGMREFLANLMTNASAAGEALFVFFDIIRQTLADLGSFFAVLTQQGTPALVAFGQLLHTLLDTLNTILPAILTSVVPAFQQLVYGLDTVLRAVGELLVQTAPAVGEFVSLFSNGVGHIVTVLEPFVAAIINISLQLMSSLLPAIVKIFDAITPLLGPLVTLVGDIANLVTPIADVAATLVGVLMPPILALLNNLDPLIRMLGQFFVQALKDVVDALDPLMKPLADLIDSLGTALMTVLRNILPPLQELIKALAKDFMQAIQPLIKPIGDLVAAISPAFAGTLKLVYEAFAKMAPPLGDILGAIATGLGAFVEWVASSKDLSGFIGIIVGGLIGWRVAMFLLTPVIVGFKLALEGAKWAVIFFNAALDTNPLILILSVVGLVIAALVILELKYHWMEGIVKGIGGIADSMTKSINDSAKQALKVNEDYRKLNTDLAAGSKATAEDIANDYKQLHKDLGDSTDSTVTKVSQNFDKLGGHVSSSSKDAARDVTNWYGDAGKAATEASKRVNQEAGADWTTFGKTVMDTSDSAGRTALGVHEELNKKIPLADQDTVQRASNQWGQLGISMTDSSDAAGRTVTDTHEELNRHIPTLTRDTAGQVVSEYDQLHGNVYNSSTKLKDDVTLAHGQMGVELHDTSDHTRADVTEIHARMGRDTGSLSETSKQVISDKHRQMWDEIKRWANDGKDAVIQIFNWFKDGLFNAMRDLANHAVRDPINWIIGAVFDSGGITDIFNGINAVLGTNWHINVPLVPGFAGGGVVPGYAPGQDTVPAMLSPGEGVLTPQATRQLGGASGIEFLNRMLGSGGSLFGTNKGGTQYFDSGGLAVDSRNYANSARAANGTVDVSGLVMGALAPFVQGVLNNLIYPEVDRTRGRGVTSTVVPDATHKFGDAFVALLKGKDAAYQAQMAAIGYNAVPAQSGDAKAAQDFAAAHLAQFGWGPDQMPPLIALWNQESGWNANAVNPSSGAYGIPQSLGHGHPYDLGDYANQVLWGLNYIKGRYGSPSAAEAHEQSFNWYDHGGYMEDGDWGRNESGWPEMVLPPDLTDLMEDTHEHWRRRHDDDDDYEWGDLRDWDDDRHRRRDDDDDDDDPWRHEDSALHELTEFLSTGQSGMSAGQIATGDLSMMTALGMGLGSGSPFGGVFLADNAHQGIGQQVGGNTGFWNEALEHHRYAQLAAIKATQTAAAVSGATGNTMHAVNSFAGGASANRAGFRPGDDEGSAGAGGVYIDCRGATLMSDHAMDTFVDKLGTRMSTWTMPAAGVRIRR